MPSKFSIDYIALPQYSGRVLTHHTDDPAALEDFLMHLLVARARIKEIRHQGVAMLSHQYESMLRSAAARLAAAVLRESLGHDTIAIKDRFNSAA